MSPAYAPVAMRIPLFPRLLGLLLLASLPAAPAPAQPADRDAGSLAAAAVRGGLGFLVGTQAEDGSWSPEPGPAVTALVLRALVQDGRHPDDDPAAPAALRYVLGSVQPDGSIRSGPDGPLAN